MAVLISFVCKSCNKEKQTMGRFGDVPEECSDCLQLRTEEKKRDTLAKRAELSLEERLSLLEEKMYDLKKQLSNQRRRPMLFGTPVTGTKLGSLTSVPPKGDSLDFIGQNETGNT